MKYLLNIGISVGIVIILYFFVPISWVDYINNIIHPVKFGTSTVIQGTDTLSASRTTINNNFSALDTGKIDVGTTSIASLTYFGNFAQGWIGSNGSIMISSTSPTVAYLYATSTTATSTFSSGLNVGNGIFTVQKGNGSILIGTTSTHSLQIYPYSPPSASTNSDAGYLFKTLSGGTYNAGLITEVTGQILSLGINAGQIGPVNLNNVGGLFRFDTRSSNHEFVILGEQVTTGTEFERLHIDLNTGTTTILKNGGWFGLATTAPVALIDGYTTASTTNLLLEAVTGKGGCLIMKDVGSAGGYTEIYTSGGTIFSKVTTSLSVCQ